MLIGSSFVLPLLLVFLWWSFHSCFSPLQQKCSLSANSRFLLSPLLFPLSLTLLPARFCHLPSPFFSRPYLLPILGSFPCLMKGATQLYMGAHVYNLRAYTEPKRASVLFVHFGIQWHRVCLLVFGSTCAVNSVAESPGSKHCCVLRCGSEGGLLPFIPWFAPYALRSCSIH